MSLTRDTERSQRSLTHPAIAVAEATRVTAHEAQPAVYVFNSFDWHKVAPGQTLCPAIDRQAFVALAESLAAFVSLELE